MNREPTTESKARAEKVTTVKDGARTVAIRRTIATLRQELATLEAQIGVAAPPAVREGSAPLLTVQEMAELTGFSPHTIRDWCEQDLLPAQKIGNRWRLERKPAILALKNLNRRRRRKAHGRKSA